jgi:hypothetical protein
VLPLSMIHTDEHKSYISLKKEWFLHRIVCYKHCFVNTVDDVDTQAVESFNKGLKYEIKNRKGIKTALRQQFIYKFVWLWNNSDDLFCNL